MTKKEQTIHRSRLAGFIIDCQTTDPEAAADFWSSALWWPRSTRQNPEEPAYIKLDSASLGLDIEVQQVEHPSRVHLDIETDDRRRGASPRGAGRQTSQAGPHVVGHGGTDGPPLLRCPPAGSNLCF